MLLLLQLRPPLLSSSFVAAHCCNTIRSHLFCCVSSSVDNTCGELSDVYFICIQFVKCHSIRNHCMPMLMTRFFVFLLWLGRSTQEWKIHTESMRLFGNCCCWDTRIKNIAEQNENLAKLFQLWRKQDGMALYGTG